MTIEDDVALLMEKMGFVFVEVTDVHGRPLGVAFEMEQQQQEEDAE